MTGVLKKGLGLLVVVFLGFWLVHRPERPRRPSKEIGPGVWDMLAQLFEALIRFLTSRSRS